MQLVKLAEAPQERARLGRHINHDPRSRNFPARRAVKPKEVKHLRHCPAYDQGDLGSCTGNAMAGLLMTSPFWKPRRNLTETDAVALYSAATRLDDFEGTYLPDDTGSSGLGVMKAAKAAGYITRYEHAFGLGHVLTALTLRPGILGIAWYSSFDEPLPSGECPYDPNSEIRGGHEIQMFGLDPVRRRVWCYQSWGPRWGGLRDGTFFFSYGTLDALLAQQGDATFASPA